MLKKCFFYFSDPFALLEFGLFYLSGVYKKKNIKKSIKYLTLASSYGLYKPNFYLGCIYFIGLEGNKDIDKAIHYFKEGSSFNDNYCKNNLGIIYKNIKHNPNAIVYFKEAIHQEDDMVAMYNLAHMYLYGELINENIDQSIDLLIKSSDKGFMTSFILLCLAIIKTNK